MKQNASSSSSWRLYVIVDRVACGDRDPVDVAAAAIRGGADVIQLRQKDGSDAQVLALGAAVSPLAQAAGIPVIINDRAHVAQALPGAGLHLGQADLPLARARSVLGPNRLIGKSTHSLEQALAAQTEGADYIGLGPIFPTPTKPDYGCIGLDVIAEVRRRVLRPVVCIGGIDAERLPRVLAAGAGCVAVVRAVCAAADPEEATRALKRILEQFHHTPSPSSL